MPRQARVISESGIYHIMLRGANKQEIFHDDEDRYRFLHTLVRYKKEIELSVFGWCLMGNHVHMLLKEGKESISDTMRRIGVSYVLFYNDKYLTSGHLFGGRFRSEPVNSEAYLKTVVRYIHQNPVKAGLVNRVEEWKWSSCRGYYRLERMPAGLLDPEFVLSFFDEDIHTAVACFKEFNEMSNADKCIDIDDNRRVRISDEKARELIIAILGDVTIGQVKSLPKPARDEILRRAKEIDGISQRQLARILGISPNIIFKA